MKIKTSELKGSALDWAVAKCEGGYDLRLVSTYGTKTAWQYTMRDEEDNLRADHFYLADTSYSTDWQLGGPIIEREDIAVWPDAEEGGWFASSGGGRGTDYKGPTPLIAAMRCYVASKLGDEVEVPDELTKGTK